MEQRHCFLSRENECAPGLIPVPCLHPLRHHYSITAPEAEVGSGTRLQEWESAAEAGENRQRRQITVG